MPSSKYGRHTLELKCNELGYPRQLDRFRFQVDTVDLNTTRELSAYFSSLSPPM
jgi:hypothetical protein